MPLDRFLIAPFTSGLQEDVRPFLLPEDAWTMLNNVYVFRGRVRKRFGGRLSGYGWSPDFPQQAPLFSRVRIQLGGSGMPVVTDGSGNATGTVPGNVFKVGQAFTIGTATYFVKTAGVAQAMTISDATATATYDTTNGAFVFAGAPATTQIYFYPAEPIMGISLYDQANTMTNNQPTWAFDTQFAYVFAGGTWTGQPTPLWHDPNGTKFNFFWIDNWRGATDGVKLMFVTNYQVANPDLASSATDDPIWWFDGTNWFSFIVDKKYGFYFAPIISGSAAAPYTGPFVQSARIIVQFKDRLCLLNTIENDNSTYAMAPNTGTNTQYVNRCRFSINGDPTAQNAWYEPNQLDNTAGSPPYSFAAGAGFIDAATDEAIVSAEFIKDRLIVFFERSTWELAYTGNQVLPFYWQKLNTELGSQSLLSSIPRDKEIDTVGNVGVFGCNGSNVDRIDQKIPDVIFNVRTANQGVYRISGIRDFYTELLYWTFPTQRPTLQYQSDSSITYAPDQVLVYNYANNSWAQFDDCITTFGYLEQQAALTWATWLWTWDQSQQPWDYGLLQANARVCLAGNQQGFIFIIDDDFPRNAPAMQISNIVITSVAVITLTIVDHTLIPGRDYIVIENALGTNMNLLNGGSYQVETAANSKTITISNPGIPTAGTTYDGCGTATRVSKIELQSKQWNPYLPEANNIFLQKIEFMVESTDVGGITVDYSPSSTTLSMIEEGQDTSTIMGTNVLDTYPYSPTYVPIPATPFAYITTGALNSLEEKQDRIIHPVYFQSVGNVIQLYMYLSDAQMTNPFIIPQPDAGPTRKSLVAWENFEIDSMTLYTNRSGRID